MVKDIGDSAKGLKTALEELLRTPCLTFIVGLIPSKFIGSASTRVNSERIPSLVFPISEDENTGGPYFIKFYYPLEERAKVISRYVARELGLRTFAVLYPKTELGIRMKKVFASGVKEYGGRLVYEGSYDPESRDIYGELDCITSIEPEAIFIPDGAAESAELIMRLKRGGKIRDVLFLGLSTLNSPPVFETHGE